MPKTDIEVVLLGQPLNILNMTAKVRKALEEAGYSDLADEMSKRVEQAPNHEAAFRVLEDYVEVV